MLNFTLYNAGSSAFSATHVDVVPDTGSFPDIRFPNVILNTGGDYNTDTGVFTCRIPGLYWFSATIGKHWGVNVDLVSCHIRLNGWMKIYLYADPHADNALDGYTSTGSVAFQLQTGDRVHVGYCSNEKSIDNSDLTHFSGMLVRPDV